MIRLNSEGIYQRFVPEVRGFQLYKRIWYLKENAPEILFKAYVEAYGLDFKELNPKIREEIETAALGQRIASANQQVEAFVRISMQYPARMEEFVKTMIYSERYGPEFKRIALLEREKYYRQGAVGKRAEPFLS
ncbi:MAG TPA: hypothetical protein VFF28_06805 [Candidatus Nanoarchaeia archaeon]|nr:hypothetical protein [Candidatus Nanoarchaeia archaeon]